LFSLNFLKIFSKTAPNSLKFFLPTNKMKYSQALVFIACGLIAADAAMRGQGGSVHSDRHHGNKHDKDIQNADKQSPAPSAPPLCEMRVVPVDDFEAQHPQGRYEEGDTVVYLDAKNKWQKNGEFRRITETGHIEINTRTDRGRHIETIVVRAVVQNKDNTPSCWKKFCNFLKCVEGSKIQAEYQKKHPTSAKCKIIVSCGMSMICANQCFKEGGLCKALCETPSKTAFKLCCFPCDFIECFLTCWFGDCYHGGTCGQCTENCWNDVAWCSNMQVCCCDCGADAGPCACIETFFCCCCIGDCPCAAATR
jgi:hypothetical protein